MTARNQSSVRARALTLLNLLTRPGTLVLLPGAMLAAFWLGGEAALIAATIGLPVVGLALHLALQAMAMPQAGRIPVALQQQLIQVMDRILQDAPATGQTTACVVVQLDNVAELPQRHGRAAEAEVLARTAERLCTTLRQGDTVARLDGGGFAIALGNVRRLDLESALQVAARLQAAIAPPFSIDAARVYATCSIGLCLAARLPEADGRALLDAAQTAADEALRQGPAAIRVWGPDMSHHRADRDALRAELETALDEGQIVAFFQPQISTDTGSLSGFEALARWNHPQRGLVPPAEFLPAMVDAGLSERLAEVMLGNALAALAQWDKCGLNVPTVAVNFSADELRNPRLAEKVRWELDRFDLTPKRLSVEILETVVADTDNDVIVANIAALANLGCGIDLDDFGTGHSSMLNLRRFSIRRIKIDRSFVTRLDEDHDQQTMVAAILSLAERLGIEALAEGVETPGEHAVLAQLGCQHVQGFGIARPMPLEDTIDWVARHRQKVTEMRRIGFRV